MVAKLFDVFLSYASEDYDDVALPLKQRLEALGLIVWLDRERMGPGASLASGLHEGLSGARCMVGVFSSHYLRKHWTRQERNAAYALKSRGRIHLIPVLHGLTEGELIDSDCLSADSIRLNTGQGLAAVAEEVAWEVRSLPPVYSVYLVSTVTAVDVIRADLQSALDAAGMTALAIDKVDGSIDVDSCRDHVGKTDLTVVIAAFRYGEPLPDEDRSTLEIACDGDRERLVLLPKKGTKLDPAADFDAGPDGPDYARQQRLDAFKRAASKDAIEYMPETLASTLTSALREWRKTRDPAPDPTVPDARPVGFERDLDDYMASVGHLYGTLRLAGFHNQLRVEVQLEDLFVPLHAHLAHGMSEVIGVDGDMEARAVGRTDQLPLTEAFWKADVTCTRRGLVLLGDPGSGKTTHQKRVLLWLVKNGAASLGLPPDTIPLFLPLRELKVGDELRAFVLRAFAQEALPVEPSFVDALLRQKNLLFLLDGLDEIYDEAARGRASSWIGKMRLARSDARFVVTCRDSGYTRDARLDAGFLEMRLAPLNTEQAEQFVNNWFRIVETGLASDPELGRRRGEEQASRLLERLRQKDVRGAARVYQLTRNPLLLTAICLVHRDRGELPKRRAELYDECIDVLLEHWHRSQGVDVLFTAKDAREVLKPVAAWLHSEENRTKADTASLAPVLLPELRRMKIGDAPDAFLRTIRDQSGLLTGWGGDLYGFMHLGFQEYLTALAIQDRAKSDPLALRDLATHFGESWWREVISLLVADGSWFVPFFREVVQGSLFPGHLDLVRECFTDSRLPSVEPFLEVLRPDAKGDDLAARREAAAAVVREQAPERLAEVGWRDAGLERRVSDVRTKSVQETRSREGNVALVWIPEGELVVGDMRLRSGGFALGKYPVTNEEYGRFLADNADVKPPAMWGDSKYNEPRQPVVGVSWHEAVQFCEWAGGRLPTEEEWEFACRAGSTTEYWFGDDEEELVEVGWFFRNSGKELLPKETKHDFEKAYQGEWQCRTHPVGELRANPWGLYDVHGNVWEWCADAAGGDRVFRGGSFDDAAVRLRSSFRGRRLPVFRDYFLGFRLAVSPPISE